MITDLGSDVLVANFLSNGQTLAVVTRTGITIRQAGTGDVLTKLDLSPSAAILSPSSGTERACALSLGPAPEKAITGLLALVKSGVIELWGLPLSGPAKVIPYREPHIYALEFSPDGKRLAGIGQQNLWLWDTQTGREIRTHRHLSAPSGSITFSPDSRTLTTSDSSRVRLFDSDTGDPRHPVPRWGEVIGLARFSADGQRIVTTRGYWPYPPSDPAATSGLQVWDVASGQLLVEPDPPIPPVANMSTDGTVLVALTRSRTIQIWDVPTRTMRYEIWDSKGVENGLYLSTDGRWVTGIQGLARDKRVWQTWDALTGEHAGSAESAFRYDWYNPVHHKRVLFNEAEKVVEVWNLSPPRRLYRLEFEDPFGEVIWPPDRASPMIRTRAPGWHRWNLTTGKKLPPLEFPAFIAKHPHPFFAGGIQFLPDGNRFLTIGDGDEIVLWDMAQRKKLKAWHGDGVPVDSVEISANGNHVLTKCNGTILVWDLDAMPEITP